MLSSYKRSTCLPTRRFLVTAIGVALNAVASTQALAQEKDTVLSKVKVSGETVDSYKPDAPASPKYTEPLRDTPQTITVIPKKVIEDQNLLSLREILSTVPGITFGAGEGGGGYGDSINIRGFSSSGDISVDGIRDSAQYTRSDPFNLDQVEVVKGSASVYSGAGAVGGTVNLVTKTAVAQDFTRITGGLGTDQYQRVTVDTNQTFSDTAAFRLNLMAHKNDAPGRDYENFERWGIAPSVTFGLGTPTRISISAFHQHDDNIPQYGVPFYNGRALPGVDSSNYYGFHNVDQQKIDSDSLTFKLDHDINDKVSLRNITRWSQVDQFALVDPPQGSVCLNNGLSPTGWSQSANASGIITTNTSGYTTCPTPSGVATPLQPGQYAPSGPRGNVRDTTNSNVTNQMDLTSRFNTASIEHTLVTGFSLSHEEYDLHGYSEFRNADGSAFSGAQMYGPGGYYGLMNIYDPDSYYSGPRNRTLTSKTSAELDNRALYAFDTLKFNEQWMLSGGIRYEHNRSRSTSYDVNTTAPIGQLSGTSSTIEQTDNLFSWRVGALYKPVETGTFYVSYGNSKTPSVSTVSGSCAGTSRVGPSCNTNPEIAETYEIGTKWDVLDEKLSLTAALFRTDRTNYRVADPGNPDNPAGEQQLDGESRVEGLELGAAGKITDQWAIYANYAYMHSEVLQGASDFAANGGATGTEQDWTKGDPLTNVPRHSASIWTTYDLTRDLQLGYGVTYQGEMYLSQHSGIAKSGTPTTYVGRSTIPLAKSEAYLVHRLSATYKVTKELNLQLNINNLFDKEYYTRIRNNGWATPGDGRQAVLTANYSF